MILLSQFGSDGIDEERAFSDEAKVRSCFFDEVVDGGEVGSGG